MTFMDMYYARARHGDLSLQIKQVFISYTDVLRRSYYVRIKILCERIAKFISVASQSQCENYANTL